MRKKVWNLVSSRPTLQFPSSIQKAMLPHLFYIIIITGILKCYLLRSGIFQLIRFSLIFLFALVAVAIKPMHIIPLIYFCV